MDNRRLAARCALGLGSFALGFVAWTGLAGAAEHDQLPVDAPEAVVSEARDLSAPADRIEVVDAVAVVALATEALPALPPQLPQHLDVATLPLAAAAPVPDPSAASGAPTEPSFVAPAAAAVVANPVTAPPADDQVFASALPHHPPASAPAGLDAPRRFLTPTAPPDSQPSPEPMRSSAALRSNSLGSSFATKRMSTDATTAIGGGGAHRPLAVALVAPGDALADRLHDLAHPPRGPPEKDAP